MDPLDPSVLEPKVDPTPPVDVIPPASIKSGFKYKALLPVLALALALPIFVKSIKDRQLANSKAANPETYPSPPPCGVSYPCPTVSPTPTNSQQIINLRGGWNPVAFKVRPQRSFTSLSLLDEINNNQGGLCGDVARWQDNKWQYSSLGNDFPIENSRGYYILCNQDNNSQLVVSGPPILFHLSDLGFTNTGWYSVSIPVDNTYTAKTFCEAVNGSYLGKVKEIDRLINNGWDGHVCGYPFNDFQIESGKGYLLKYELAGQIATPSKLAGLTNIIPTPTPTSTLPIVAFAFNSSSGTEGVIRNTTSQIKVTLSKASTKNISVNYQTVGGTATSGVDYKLSPGILTFSPGQTTKYIVLEIINDTLKESSETILIDLYAPQNATLGTLKRLQFTLVDND